ncbi:MAG: hypothetical protein Q4B57_10535 [Eubacteriales bacterium]|nr:hypothetical protein [Eubacteriales bacterium]
MNYEALYEQLQPLEKNMKDKLAALQKLQKNIVKETESGDLKGVLRDLQTLSDTTAALNETIENLQKEANEFDSRTYFENGDFAEQMMAACEDRQIDVQGEFPVYEMFPYRVKLDAENQDVYIDRKKVQCMRPQSLAELVKTGQAKLNKASFNAEAFANELAEAYDIALLKQKKSPGTDIYLSSLYKLLAPMSRSRKEYDQQSFAFDLARLYIKHLDETKNGRKFQFGPSRNTGKAIRILDQNGKEEYLTTICFYEKEK